MRGIRLAALAPCVRHAHALQGKTWFDCSWLHSLKVWSLLKTRFDSLCQWKTVFLNKSVGALNGFLVLGKPALAARACDGLGNTSFSGLRDINLQGLRLGKQENGRAH